MPSSRKAGGSDTCTSVITGMSMLLSVVVVCMYND